MADPDRAGRGTSEFLLASYVLVACGVLFVAGLLAGLRWPLPAAVAMLGASLVAATVGAVYIHSRGKVKAPRPYLTPQGRL